MMKQEFEERANFKVSPECYHTFIEPGYNASNLDKDEWVKEWKKNGGVQLENLPEAFQEGEKGDTMQEAIDNLSNAMDAIDEATEYINEATN